MRVPRRRHRRPYLVAALALGSTGCKEALPMMAAVLVPLLAAVDGAGTRPPLRPTPGASRPRPPGTSGVNPRSTVGSLFPGRKGSGQGGSGPGGSFPGFDSGSTAIQGRQPFPTESGISLSLPARYAQQPRFLRRTDWDSNPPRRAWSGRGQSSLESITVHHSAAPDTQKVSVIRDYHKGKGFADGDIAYHFLITHDGDIYEGLPLNVVGRHSPPNARRIGICLIGKFHQDDVRGDRYASMRESFQYLVEALDAAFPGIKGRIRPHGPEKLRSVKQDKVCPGDSVEEWLDGVWERGWSRSEVQGRRFAYREGGGGHAHGAGVTHLHEEGPGEDEHVPEGWTPAPPLP